MVIWWGRSSLQVVIRSERLRFGDVDSRQVMRRGLAAVRSAPFPALLTILLGGMWLFPGAVHFGPFETADSSRAFISTLWQVEAAALGLSVALVVFVFEAFQRSGYGAYGGSLRDFAARTSLTLLLRLALASLIIDGACLLHFGQRAPAGWSALWATAWAGAVFVSIAYVLQRTVVAVDPEPLRELRRERLRTEVEQEIAQGLLDVLAYSKLYDLSQSHYFRFAPFGFAPPVQAPAIAITSASSGRVADIHVTRLMLMAGMNRLSETAPLTVCAWLGEAVDAGQTLLVLPGPINTRLGRLIARHTFKVRGG